MRRGRNNRLLVKLIEKNIFEDEDSYDHEEGKSLLKKRRKTYYDSALDYIDRALPSLKTSQAYNLLRDKKFMFKRLRKTQTLFVKDAARKMVKEELKSQPAADFAN